MVFSLLPSVVITAQAEPLYGLGDLLCPSSVAADEAFDIEIRNIKSQTGGTYLNYDVVGPIQVTVTPTDGFSFNLRLEIYELDNGWYNARVPAGTFTQPGQYTLSSTLDLTFTSGGTGVVQATGSVTITAAAKPDPQPQPDPQPKPEPESGTGNLLCPSSVAADKAFDIEIRNLKNASGSNYLNYTVLGPIQVTAVSAGSGSPVQLSLELYKTEAGLFNARVPGGSFPEPGQYTLSSTLSVRFNYDGTLHPSVQATGSVTITAAAQPEPEACTVFFDANGGQVSASHKSVTKDAKYGSMPTPTRDGYTFDGWFTAASGGSQITSSTIVTQTEDHTLYAHWTPTATGPSLSALTYSFSNSSSAYGYSPSYKIPLARYQLIFGNTAFAQSMYRQAGPWSGNCYGMSSTTSLFFQAGNGVATTNFKGSASLPSALSINDRNSSWNLTVTEFIEAMQVSQFGAAIQGDYQSNKNQLNKLCQAVSSFQRTGKEPVVIAIFGNEGGHAVVGYDVVNVSATESRLMVYDCNYPKAERYITLTKNSSGQYTGWYYRMNNTYNWGSRYSGSWISYVPYPHFLASWNNRKGANNVNLLTINTDQADIKDVNGNIIASIQNGEVLTDREDIYPVINIGLTEDGSAGGNTGTSLWIPADSLYTVTNTDRAVSNFEVTMVHVEQSATVSTTASEIVLAVNDEEKLNYAGLSQTSGDSYTITLNSTLKDSYGDVQLTGTSVQGASPALSQIAGKLYANGVDLSTNASLRVDGAVASSSILSGAIPGISEIFGGSHGTGLPFTDVKQGDWYEAAVRNLYQRGLMNGVSDTLFDPDGSLTRAHLVTILHRLDGSPSVSNSAFSDVPKGTWYHDGVQWAASKGIVTGYGDGSFGPEDMLTREQMFTILFRYAQHKGYDVSQRSAISSYRDASEISNYAVDAMQWSRAEGLTYIHNNSDSAYLRPRNIATRAEIAWSVWQFIFNLEK